LSWASKREVPAGTPPGLAFLERAGYIARSDGGYALTYVGRLLADHLGARAAEAGLAGGGAGTEAVRSELRADAAVAWLRSFGLPAEAVQSGSDGSSIYVAGDGLPREITRDMLVCPACGWRGWRDDPWPVGRGTRPVPSSGSSPFRTAPPYRAVHTPGVRTIAGLCEYLGIDVGLTSKILFYRASWPGDRTGLPRPAADAASSGVDVVAALVMGADRLDEEKLRRATGAGRLEMAEPDYVLARCGAPVGSAGPVALKNALVVADLAVMAAPELVVGANRTDYHLAGVVPGRDFVPHLVADLRVRGSGDPCPACGRPLREDRAIELAAAGAVDTWRLMVALAQFHHDEHGLVWPPAASPWQIVIVPVGPADSPPFTAAAALYEALVTAEASVLLDDRPASAGVKFTDADLLGIPWRVTAGSRSLAQGTVELRHRAGGAVLAAPAASAAFVDFCREHGVLDRS